eukprot:6367932-Amphidinium_carterae.4
MFLELHRMNARFKYYDVSGDGRLNSAEVRQVLEDLRRACNASVKAFTTTRNAQSQGALIMEWKRSSSFAWGSWRHNFRDMLKTMLKAHEQKPGQLPNWHEVNRQAFWTLQGLS